MIPVVDGLLPEPHNSMMLTLLYRLAEWHALAKLRMHTEYTLQCLDRSTTTIGQELRKFRDTSLRSFKCLELPKETAIRQRRRERAQVQKAQSNIRTPANANGSSTNVGSQTLNPGTITEGATSVKKGVPLPKPRTLNLFTYKFHALGDYVRTIRLFGTTDSYSTQIVSASFPHFFRH